MRRKLYLALLLVLTGSSVAAAEKPIAIAVSAPLGELNPLTSTEAGTQRTNELLHLALVRMGPDLRPVPDLAESFSYKSPRLLEFRLKRGCLFADGSPVDAHTVVEAWRRYTDPSSKSSFRESLARIQSMKTEGPYVLRLELSEPAPSLLSDLSLLKALHPKDPLIGAGPYKVASRSRGNLLLEANPFSCIQPADKARPLPLLLKVVRDDLSRFLKLRTGELDLVLNELNYRKVERVLKGEESALRAWTGEGVAFTYLGLNSKAKSLQDPRVRRALALSLDRDSITRYKNRGMSSPAIGILSPSNYYFHPRLAQIPYDPEESRRLLDEAGYYNTKNKKPILKVKYLTNSNPAMRETARIVVTQAATVGIELEHQSLEFGSFMGQVRAGNTELYQLRWVGAVDPSIYAEAFQTGGKNNRTHFKNAELDALATDAEKTVAPEKRRALYWKIQEIVQRELPYISLWHNSNAVVYRKDLQQVRIPPNASWRFLQDVRRSGNGR